jgi:hypothetical protein
MNLKEAEFQLASRRLLEVGRVAQDTFADSSVRLVVDDTNDFRVTLLLDGRPLAAVQGDNPMEVSDALAGFLIHLITRPISV